MARLTETLLRRVPSRHVEALLLFFGLPLMVVVVAWTIVHQSPLISTGLVFVFAALTFWLRYPQLIVYVFAVLCPFALEYEVGGVMGLKVHDAVIAVACVYTISALLNGTAPVGRFQSRTARVVLGFWLFLIIWSSISYVLGPANIRWFGSNPILYIWYLYRGVWRNLLIFPLIVLCISDLPMARKTVDLILVVSVGVATNAILLSWQSDGAPATGHFSWYNTLAAFLVLVIPFAAARVFLEKKWYLLLVGMVPLVILLRALWLTKSRGGFVACSVSLVPLLLLVPRKRLVLAGAAGLLALIMLFVMRGNLLERPNVQRYLTLSRATEVDTFRFRLEQWDIFLERIAQRPLIGSGDTGDTALRAQGRLASTHNGFLGVAYQSGIPAAAAWAAFLTALCLLSLKHARSESNAEAKAFWIGTMGICAAWATHSMVDNALTMHEAQQLFWVVVGIGVVRASRGGEFGSSNSYLPRIAT